jgi:hypothetical protein
VLGVHEAVGSNPAIPTPFHCFTWVWLNLVERAVRIREVAGSNPVTQMFVVVLAEGKG